ncbi:MAG: hypothetical protein Ct9H300mP28_00240 [Pseudomonadota bacterium]|nr:MAG: hypothetical protein Ct9H300mP28_00240 [Pseudomonadota bacterium]
MCHRQGTLFHMGWCGNGLEGFFYWDDWDNYIGVKDERGMIKYMKTGSIMFKLQGKIIAGNP